MTLEDVKTHKREVITLRPGNKLLLVRPRCTTRRPTRPTSQRLPSCSRQLPPHPNVIGIKTTHAVILSERRI